MTCPECVNRKMVDTAIDIVSTPEEDRTVSWHYADCSILKAIKVNFSLRGLGPTFDGSAKREKEE